MGFRWRPALLNHDRHPFHARVGRAAVRIHRPLHRARRLVTSCRQGQHIHSRQKILSARIACGRRCRLPLLVSETTGTAAPAASPGAKSVASTTIQPGAHPSAVTPLVPSCDISHTPALAGRQPILIEVHTGQPLSVQPSCSSGMRFLMLLRITLIFMICAQPFTGSQLSARCSQQIT
jgi:hypothetical protein